MSHIAPPELRRAQAASREWKKARKPTLPIRKTLENLPTMRLHSRRPIWTDNLIQSTEPFRPLDEWTKQLNDQGITAEIYALYLTKDPPGFNEHGKIWVTLNRIQTGVGRCNYNLHKWGYKTSAGCDCGAPEQTIAHIVEECPRRRFAGGIGELCALTPDARNWLSKLDIRL